MKASEIQSVVHPTSCRLASPGAGIMHLLTDSRRLDVPRDTLFFAIPTARNTGVRYIDSLYRAGVRSFIVPSGTAVDYPDINLWEVPDVIRALQLLAAHRRRQFDIPVIGITGSNGKTIVKDWLVQLLSPDYHIVSSPKSYNSQIGVPLSVWQMGEEHDLAIFEAGISQPGEMEALRQVIQPTMGVLTNIGHAHDENFTSLQQKQQEKCLLFSTCSTVVCNEQYPLAHACRWGSGEGCAVRIHNITVQPGGSLLELSINGTPATVTIPFTDRASQQNALTCITLMASLGYPPSVIARRCATLAPVEMRLEILQAVGNSLLINDSYSLDLASLDLALDQLVHQHRYTTRTLIISDIPQTGLPPEQLYLRLAALLRQKGIGRLFAVGPQLMLHRSLFSGLDARFYPSTEDLLSDRSVTFRDEAILLKGARSFGFERIARTLRYNSHETTLEVNLDALIHNLNHYRSRLRPGTRLMAMVKASSYGAGTVEVASALQYHHVDYLTVAYADEGVTLRRGGITLPIMVMNPEPSAFDDIIRYRLEPDIYSLRILNLFAGCLETNPPAEPYPVHIEFDTGMHRLGFSGDDLPLLLDRLRQLSPFVRVQSVFSHLACSEDPSMDHFTRAQISRFQAWSAHLPGIKHILNSSGITRFPEAQLDMVRLGIGLYGIAPEPDVQQQLRQVSRLVTRISQIKDIPAGDTVGYNCRWQATRPSRIAILTIGYADGLNRHLGNGRGRVLVGSHEAPIIGSVCMDMCFADVTGIPCSEGDRAVFFGDGDLLQRNAAAADTIPYELLTSVSPRVKRVYYHEE